MKEEEIAALDGDWSEFTPAQQAAFVLARKLSYEPHLITDADIDHLCKHYKNLQILEIVFSVAGNNSTNRWKEGIGVPQEKEATRFLKMAEKPVPQDRPLPQWVRLLVNFPRDGKARVVGLRNADEKGDLKPLLKAQVSWIIARQDRAWYAVGEAKQRLVALGCSEDQIYKLDGDWKEFTPAERALFTLARNLAAAPIVSTDEDVAEALRLTGPREVVQLISYTTGRAFFDRVTEAAGLQLEK